MPRKAVVMSKQEQKVVMAGLGYAEDFPVLKYVFIAGYDFN